MGRGADGPPASAGGTAPGAVGSGEVSSGTEVAGLALLIVDGALLGGIGLAFTPLYVGTVPVPMGAVLSILVLPWLVARAAEIDPRGAVASAPLVAWLLVVAGLGLTGPGGDVLLPATWPSLLLFVGGVASGLVAVRRVLNSEHLRAGVG